METIQKLFMPVPFSGVAVAHSLWLIVALPLVGALVSGLFGRWLGRANTHFIACGAVFGSFVLSVLAFWGLNDAGASALSPFSHELLRFNLAHDYGTWFQAGTFRAQLGLRVDALSGSMLLVITGVGYLIHLYSTEYMSHDPGFGRYFAYLNLFVAAMLTLVLADNLLLLFVGWEGVGLCSYLLIGFWYSDPQKAYAGRKAFITNRIGDFGFLLGAMLLVLLMGAVKEQASGPNFPRGVQAWKDGVTAVGPLNFQGLEEWARGTPPHAQPGQAVVALDTVVAAGPLKGRTFGQVLTWALLLFLLGAAGKSAQLPLYVWLPDAMAGPTPVSALIHAATMVTAGVYLFCRLNFLLVLSPAAMATVALVGGATALLAALIAFAQDDIKKVLAYSTVSQLGLMFLGVGVGIFWAAFLHLVTHAFFKACLFLGAGSVMHGNQDETDIKKLGGVRKEMPVTAGTFFVASLAITGIVPLSGFFSKDAILHAAHTTHLLGFEWATPVAYAMGVLAAVCTAFYMTRLYLLTFEGKRSADARAPHAHESGWAMTLPLVVLAFLSVVFLVWGLPMKWVPWEEPKTLMEAFLGSVFRTQRFLVESFGLVKVEHEAGLPVRAWVQAWVLAVAGGGLAVFLYRKFFPGRVGKPLPPVWRWGQRFAQAKFYVDELYDWVVVQPVRFLSFILYKVADTLLIDTVAVRGSAWITARVGSALRYFQTGDAQSYAAVMVLALLGGALYALSLVIR